MRSEKAVAADDEDSLLNERKKRESRQRLSRNGQG
jgi:hypothetical protein